MIAEHGEDIAQIVRGEMQRLADDERTEILQSRRSYYPEDLVVIGWTAALVYDTPEGALPVIQLLEYANSQLLEFRYYDEMLTRLLADVYRSLDKGTGVLARWRLAREAGRLNTIRLDVRELTERMDNSIKFLSDMYLRAGLPPGRRQGGRHRLPHPGGRKAAHRRRPVPVHDGPVSAGPRVRAGVAGGGHFGDRAGVPVRGKDLNALIEGPQPRAV